MAEERLNTETEISLMTPESCTEKVYVLITGRSQISQNPCEMEKIIWLNRRLFWNSIHALGVGSQNAHKNSAGPVNICRQENETFKKSTWLIDIRTKLMSKLKSRTWKPKNLGSLLLQMFGPIWRVQTPKCAVGSGSHRYDFYLFICYTAVFCVKLGPTEMKIFRVSKECAVWEPKNGNAKVWHGKRSHSHAGHTDKSLEFLQKLLII